MAPSSAVESKPVTAQLPKVSFQEWRAHLLCLLRPYRTPLILAHLAMLLDAVLTVMRPWPLKVVIDRVITQKPTRVPFIGSWLNHLALDRQEILYGACATSLLIALGTPEDRATEITGMKISVA